MNSAFAAGFFGQYSARSAERREAKREEEKELRDAARRREERLEILMEQRKNALIPAIIKNQASRNELSSTYENSVKALGSRLKDEEGNFIPGAEALLSDPLAAHNIYTSILEEEKRAAEKDLPIKKFTGQDIVDRATVYSSETGERTPIPSISFEDMLSGNFTLEEGYKVAYGGTGTTPEPAIEFSPQVATDPSKFEEGREIWKSRVSRELDKAIMDAKEQDTEKFVELTTLKESFDRDPDGPAATQVESLFGTNVYMDMLEEGSEYFYLENDPFFTPIRRKLQDQQVPEVSEPSSSGDDIAILQKIISDPTATEQEKQEAQELLKIIAGQ
jgi:hypothetical protein